MNNIYYHVDDADEIQHILQHWSTKPEGVKAVSPPPPENPAPIRGRFVRVQGRPMKKARHRRPGVDVKST